MVNGKARIFRIHDTEIRFSQAQDIYNTIFFQVNNPLRAAIGDYEQFYRSHIHSFDDIFTYLPKAADSRIVALAQKAVSILANHGVLSYTSKSFYQQYVEELSFSPYMSDLLDARAQIIQTKEAQAQARAVKKASRGRWQGGGFGLSGAIKGAMMAGALNAGSGLLHGVGDSLAAAGDRRQIEKMKRQVFQNPQTRKSLIGGFQICCTNIFYAMLDVLANEHDLSFPQYNAERAATVLENASDQYEEDNLSEEDYFHYLIQCIQLNPYTEEIYGSLFELYPEDDTEIRKMADYLGLSQSYAEQKSSIIESLLEDINDWSDDTISDVHEKIQSLNELSSKYNAANSKELQIALKNAHAKLEKLLKIKDEQERTALGVLFTTKQEADFVRSEWKTISPILQKYSYFSDVTAAQQCYQELQSVSVSHPLVIEQIAKVQDQISILNAKRGSFQEEMVQCFSHLWGSNDFGDHVIYGESFYEDMKNPDSADTDWVLQIIDQTIEHALLFYGEPTGILVITDAMIHGVKMADEKIDLYHFSLHGSPLTVNTTAGNGIEVASNTQKFRITSESLKNRPQFVQALKEYIQAAQACTRPYITAGLGCERLLKQCAPWLDTSQLSLLGQQMQRLKDSVFIRNPFPEQLLQIFPNKMWRWQFNETQYGQMIDAVKENHPVELPLILFQDDLQTGQTISAFMTNNALYHPYEGKIERIALSQITDISFQTSLTNPAICINHDIFIPVKHISQNRLIDLAQFFGNTIQTILGNDPPQTNENKSPIRSPDTVSVRLCSKCGEPLEPDAKFCSSCGAVVVKYCSECGAENEADAIFCMECGVKLL